MAIPDVTKLRRDALSRVETELQAKTDAFVRKARLPGARVGIVDVAGLAWSGGSGFADIASRRPADDGTLNRIASITKTFTATAIMQLRDEGRLALDDPAVEHLPELRSSPQEFGPVETITIRRLLSHESGLLGDPPGTDWDVPTYEASAAANLARASEIGQRVPPNSQTKYSNLGYQLLGEIVARVSGRPYADYLRAEILDPLEMSGTGFPPLAPELEGRRATGYAPRWFSDDLAESVAAPDTQAEGGLLSCVGDLARWVAFQLREDGGERSGAQVLAGRSLAEMHRPRYLAGDLWDSAWGICWYAVRRDDVAWVMHNGGIHGFISNVSFDPKAGIGAVALINGLGDADGLALELAAVARAAVKGAPRPAEPPTPLPDAYRDLIGFYMDRNESGLVRLEWREGKLTFVHAQYEDWRPTLTPGAAPDQFVVDQHVREAGEPCVFHRRADGRVQSVKYGPSTFRRLDPVD
jgi:CubicO group peptidase (beta-lactamase class C family)